jgi:hypothetical protein
MKKFNVRSASVVLGGAVSLLSLSCNSTPTPIPSPSPSLGGFVSTNVTTSHNDQARTGQNLTESILTRANVNSTTFGKIGSLPVDGVVYAQPLVAQGVQVGSASHDLVLVATEHDSVYAFDTQSLSATPLWHRNFVSDCLTSPGTPTNCTVPSYTDVGAPNVTPEIGITATPVIDTAAGTMYVTAMTKESGFFYWRLHALSLATGAEQPGSPVTIDASFPGSGVASALATDGLIYFAAQRQLSRAGLVLNNGLIQIAFSSFDDQEPSHGWVFAYNASTLDPVSAWMTSANSGLGSIWQAGAAPAVDASGNLFFATANGDANFISDLTDLGDSVLKLSFTEQGFELGDYFTPYNHDALALGDVDLGSGGVVLLPDQTGVNPHLLISAGKQGTIYVLNRDNLGKIVSNPSASSDTQIVQEVTGVLPGGTSDGNGQYGLPAYFNGKLFFQASGDFLRSIPLTNGLLDAANIQQSTIKNKVRGATPSISANGTADGIVWFTDNSAYTYSVSSDSVTASTFTEGSAVLYAYSTDDLSTPLYASPVHSVSPIDPIHPNLDVCTAAGTDDAGCAVKFAVPTVANGMVFVGTNAEISVYGLRNSTAATRE